MLHTINKSPFNTSSLESCIRFVSADDVVLLFEDAVYAATGNTNKSYLVESLLKTCKVYALSADIKARGVDDLIAGVETTDYDGFVDLVEAHNVQAWL
ncbi:MAG: sulfurtransferase complex subunit TusB [endosymbiont of Galathealinum brachiosum]|uniref:Sulfurtransferase complex subunit TusB n=1 Tax=endosymbiont of Galathealinum brachiosum TaxID=2200906 RepID=A0A370DEN6_9GAMM|nr:MAG: sulfurtransferase complex subunit TusB [endosymbiont of Galathealinum brachiosum]